ncbi:MAG: recombination protein O N-terminal domain-containing protein [Spirochaetia bacterium]|nr:recombination protein O N-terminal domain-containing protein [Spirochaetia bacterium]
MKEVRTRGVLLSRSPLREYDEQVQFFTEDLGKISALSFGSRSARSTRRMHLAGYDWLEIALAQSREGWNLKGLALWQKNLFLEDPDKAEAFLNCLKTLRDHFVSDDTDSATIGETFHWLRQVFQSDHVSAAADVLELLFHLGLLVILGIYPYSETKENATVQDQFLSDIYAQVSGGMSSLRDAVANVETLFSPEGRLRLTKESKALIRES